MASWALASKLDVRALVVPDPIWSLPNMSCVAASGLRGFIHALTSRDTSLMGDGHVVVLALGSSSLYVPLDFRSSPSLSFVQSLVISLLIQEIAGMWTSLSWQLPSGLHLVTQGEESLLVLVWLMELGRVCTEGQQGGGFLPEASCCWTQAGCGRERASEGGVKTLALQICYSFDYLDHQWT